MFDTIKPHPISLYLPVIIVIKVHPLGDEGNEGTTTHGKNSDEDQVHLSFFEQHNFRSPLPMEPVPEAIQAKSVAAS